MAGESATNTSTTKERGYWSLLRRDMYRDRWLYFLLFFGMLYFVIFKYIPMIDLRIAFMDYNPFAPEKSTWVGLAQFQKLFTRPAFVKVLKNTIKISLLKFIFGFPLPIILALMMNEMRNLRFKKVTQTILYLPYFISWVVMAGLIMTLLDPGTGILSRLIASVAGREIHVLTDKKAFVPMLIISDMYKGMGWGTIVYLAALAGVDPQLYEAASIDGAKRFRQMIHITLPAITPTIITMLILNANNILNAGFDQIFMLYSAPVYDVADIIDTYVYRMGIQKTDYSFTTAAGMFKSIVALIMILTVNYIAKKTDNEGLW